MAHLRISKIILYGVLWLALYGIAAIMMWLLDVVLRCVAVWAAMLLYQEMAARTEFTPAERPARGQLPTAQESHVGITPLFPEHYDVRGRERVITFSHDEVPPPYTAEDSHMKKEPYSYIFGTQ